MYFFLMHEARLKSQRELHFRGNPAGFFPSHGRFLARDSRPLSGWPCRTLLSSVPLSHCRCFWCERCSKWNFWQRSKTVIMWTSLPAHTHTHTRCTTASLLVWFDGWSDNEYLQSMCSMYKECLTRSVGTTSCWTV